MSYGLEEASQDLRRTIDPFASDVPTYAPASTRDTAQEIVVRAGAESNGVDIQYRGGSGHTVSGTASGPNSDQPLRLCRHSSFRPAELIANTRAAQRPE